MAFYVKTWSGRIILINAIFFLLTSYYSGSVLTAENSVLISFGAKYAIGLAQGEFYRLISPVFLHAGLLHFFLNNFALKAVGGVVEAMVPSWFFLLLYFLTGIFGNVFSYFANTIIGVGASGAIFGLIGFGCGLEIYHFGLFEREWGYGLLRLLKKPFILTGWVNILIGYLLNLFLAWLFSSSTVVDNSAHWGGLLCGAFLGLFYALARSRQRLLYLLLGCAFISVAALGTGGYLEKSSYISDLYFQAGEESKDVGEKYFLFGQSLRARTDYVPGLLARIKMAVKYDELMLVCDDLLALSSSKDYDFSSFTLLQHGYLFKKEAFIKQLEKFNENLHKGAFVCDR